jgi:hypothetical protein
VRAKRAKALRRELRSLAPPNVTEIPRTLSRLMKRAYRRAKRGDRATSPSTGTEPRPDEQERPTLTAPKGIQ